MAKRKTEEESLRKGNPTRRNSKVAIDFETLVAAGIAQRSQGRPRSREGPGPTQRDKQDQDITS